MIWIWISIVSRQGPWLGHHTDGLCSHCGETINRTGPHRAGNDWLFRFGDEL